MGVCFVGKIQSILGAHTHTHNAQSAIELESIYGRRMDKHVHMWFMNGSFDSEH